MDPHFHWEEINAGCLWVRVNDAGAAMSTWIPFSAAEWMVEDEFEAKHCQWIDRMQSAGRIRAACRQATPGNLCIQIHVLVNPESEPVASFGAFGQHFLDLISGLDRRPVFIPENENEDAHIMLKEHDPDVLPGRVGHNLLDLFIHMPSPARISLPDDSPPDLVALVDRVLDRPFPDGMKTTLYHYQRASLWKILQRELLPQRVLRTEAVQLTAVDGSHYYFDQLTSAVSRTPFLEQDIPGGIICEDMGTGKTYICLSAIVTTRHFLAPPDPSKVSSIKSDFLSHCQEPSLPRLRDLAIDSVLVNGIHWRLWEHRLPVDIIELFRKYPAYYEWSNIPAYLLDRPRRRPLHIPVIRVYWSSSTLVIVPDNLVAQWQGEIYKHIRDDKIRYLVLDNPKKKIPSPIELLEFDLVLISQHCFSIENDSGGFDYQGVLRQCECPYVGSKGERSCQCPTLEAKDSYVSPLLQVHWKRIITDEGHRLSSKNRQSELTTKLFASWRWICTGTPTQNLTESATVRTRHEGETDDLDRLGTLLGQVLKLAPFDTQRKVWHRLIVRPFSESKPWAVTNLRHLMYRVMVRNRKCDIEQDIQLPPLYHKQVYLDFDYYQWMAHNCQIAMIGLNAILSKREGPDYLFSRNNNKALRETVHNLWQSCLWHSIDLRWLQASYDNCVEKLEDIDKARDSYGEEDLKALHNIKNVLEHALEDKMFLEMMTKHTPSFVIQGLPNLMAEKWGWVKGDHGAYDEPPRLPRGEGYCVVQGDIVVDLMRDTNAAGKENKDIYVYNANDDTLQSTEVLKHKAKTSVEQDMSTMTFYTRSVFSDACVLSSSSSKINYLVDEIIKYHKTDKCIIFSLHYNEMQEIYLALQLAKVRTLMYLDSHMTNANRSQTILTFNTSENANVIIMAVQRAAYGIDLSSATRVYFVSPVWQKAMEQQAIKRAHRIGQTKPVYVETLVIRHSFEHKILERREIVSKRREGNQKQTEFYRDKKLGNILSHAQFVPLPDRVTRSIDGTLHQPIVPFRIPLRFVTPKKQQQEQEQEPKQEEQSSPSLSTTRSAPVPASIGDEDIIDIDDDLENSLSPKTYKTIPAPIESFDGTSKRTVSQVEPESDPGKKRRVTFAL